MFALIKFFKAICFYVKATNNDMQSESQSSLCFCLYGILSLCIYITNKNFTNA